MSNIIFGLFLLTGLSAFAKSGPTIVPSKGVFEGMPYVGFVKEVLSDGLSSVGCHSPGYNACDYPKIEKTLLTCKADVLFSDGRKTNAGKVPRPGGSGQIVIERIRHVEGYLDEQLINFKFIYVATNVRDAGYFVPVFDNSDAVVADIIPPWYGGPSWFRGNRAAEKIIKEGCSDYECPILARTETAVEQVWLETKDNSYDPQSKTYENKFGAAGLKFDNETRTLTLYDYDVTSRIGSLIPKKKLVVRCSDKL